MTGKVKWLLGAVSLCLHNCGLLDKRCKWSPVTLALKKTHAETKANVAISVTK